MALSTPNASYSGQGPTKTGQLLAFGGSDYGNKFVLQGTFEVTGGDGSDTAFDVNWVDGTETLAFTPTAVLLSRIPATTIGDEAAEGIDARVSVISTTLFTVQLSTYPASGKAMKFAFLAW